MKKYLYIFIAFSLLLSCDKEPKKPEPPKPPEPDVCDCLEEINTNIVFDCGYDDPPTEVLVWDYPVKPGMPEWKELLSVGYDTLLAALQIPEEILSSLTTEELTEICLQYPWLFDVFNYYTLNIGADYLYREFNGIRELFEREDAVKWLLKYYNCKIQTFEFNWLVSNPITNLEFLLGFYMQKSEVLSKEDYLNILQSLITAHEKEIEYYYPMLYVFCTNFYARAQAIIKISPKCIEKFSGRYENGSLNYGGYDRLNKTDDIVNELSYCLIN